MDKRDSRDQLRAVLQKTLDDSEFRPGKLDTLMEQYPFLGRAERAALIQLSNWEADQALRQQVPRFAEFSRQRLNNILDALC